jgi:hypothetical protein
MTWINAMKHQAAPCVIPWRVAMRGTKWASRMLLVAPCMLATAVAADAPPTPYQPLRFLIGHCWKGKLADGKQTDEHCFTWIYDQKFVRDLHVVKAAGQPDRRGESIYLWNPTSKLLEYIYIESDGGASRGNVLTQGTALVFPPTSYLEDGKNVTYRSRWIHATDDSYDVTTEFQSNDAWLPGFSVHMKRAPGG